MGRAGIDRVVGKEQAWTRYAGHKMQMHDRQWYRKGTGGLRAVLNMKTNRRVNL